MNENITFENLNVDSSLIQKLNELNITIPTAVQKQAIPLIEDGKSVLFESETGTGKTFAFLLPLISKILKEENQQKSVKLLVVAPTFELASQIKVQVQGICSLKTVLLIGGAPVKRQIESLKEKPSIVIGTPARLLELNNLKKLKLDSLNAIVLDEVDRLLSVELKDYTKELLNCTKKDIQLVACSATITKPTVAFLSNSKIKADGNSIGNVETLFLPKEDVLKSRIEHWAIFAERRDKIETLRKFLVAEKNKKVLVFTGKLDQVENIVSKLKYKGIECEGLHAKVDKVKRKSTIDKFRSGKCPVLVTSDLTSRGLDIPDITHVVQMDLPSNDDFFVHRAGRTARAGKNGINIVIGDEYEMNKFARLEKKLGIKVYPKMLYKGKIIDPMSIEDEK